MFNKLTFFSFILGIVLVTLGSYAHLSENGLGCPDWPTCFGHFFISPDDDLKAITGAADTAQTINRWGMLAEMAYRYLTVLFGFSLVMTAIAAWWHKHYRLAAVTQSLMLLVIFGLQAVSGYWATISMAEPLSITVLVLLEMLVCWWLFWLMLPKAAGKPSKLVTSRLLINFNGFALLALLIHVAYVTWRLANYANFEYRGMPTSWSETWLFAGEGVFTIDDTTLKRWLFIGSVSLSFTLLSILAAIAVVKPQNPAIKTSIWLAWLLFAVLVALEIVGYFGEMPLWAVVAHNVTGVLVLLPLIFIAKYGRPGMPKEKADVVAAAQAGQRAFVPEEVVPVILETKPESLYTRLTSQLHKTRTGLSGLLDNLSLGQKHIDHDLLEELETKLLMADIGINVTQNIIGQLTESLERHQLNDFGTLTSVLRHSLLQVLEPCSQVLTIPKQDRPFVILVVGINGAGKTTTIGKMAKKLQGQGHSVMLAAGDTFRAAAVEQLQAWGERNDIVVVAQHTGADSASVIFDALQSAQAKKIDVLIADTAGRLHTKSNLMDELKKVKRIMAKLDETAPHEVLLVLDAGTGQNALSQAKLFNEAVGVTGMALTKLDGTAKGGVIFALSQQLGIPIRFIGIGEGIDDLQDFKAEAFVDALLARD